MCNERSNVKTQQSKVSLEYHSKVMVVHFISMQLFQLYSVVLNSMIQSHKCVLLRKSHFGGQKKTQTYTTSRKNEFPTKRNDLPTFPQRQMHIARPMERIEETER